MAQVIFTEVTFGPLMRINIRYNDANNQANRLIIENETADYTIHAEAERKDDPTQFFELDVGPNTTDEFAIPSPAGLVIGFDPEEGEPSVVESNFIVRAWASKI